VPVGRSPGAFGGPRCPVARSHAVPSDGPRRRGRPVRGAVGRSAAARSGRSAAARSDAPRRASGTPGPWGRQNRCVHIPAKVDYGMRALLTLAQIGEPATAESLASAQDLPAKFLGSIMNDLRRAGIVASQRGAEGGYRLARPPAAIAVADVMRALDGPLAEVRGLRPEDTRYEGAAAHLQDVWVAVRASMRRVLEQVSLADVVSGRFPASVARLTDDPGAWVARSRP